jgi:dTDP-4-amino-4,6-dideoxygalactose transaminase
MSTFSPSDVVPFVDLITPHRELEEELVAVFREALRSAEFIGGRQVEAFEQEFAAYCGTSECVGVANGTDALRLALLACGVGRGDAVVTVANTFIATVEAITMVGAETEFVDIDERTYNMGPLALEEYLGSCEIDAASGRPIGRRSGQPIKAIVPVHLYGQMADMEPILALAGRYGLVVVEDACQAHGAQYQMSDGSWHRAGSLGRAGAFSFYPSKNLGACGDAGAVTTNDPSVALMIRMLRDHGQATKHVHVVEGCNSRLDAIQAGFLRVKLRHLEAANVKRRLAAAGYAALLADVTTVTLPYESDRSRAVYHLYVIRHDQCDVLHRDLNSRGIDCGRHYPVPLNLQQCHRFWADGRARLPLTERVATEAVSLPMSADLTSAQQQLVVDQIRSSLSMFVA